MNETAQPARIVKTPPFLLGATVLFWGWQTGFLEVSAIMAIVLESARFVKLRLDLADEDFSRIWTFCTLLAFAAAVYAFASNEGPASFGKLFHEATAADKQGANTSSIHTAAALLRWLPMVMFLFVAAQIFSTRGAIPLQQISFFLRRRLRKARWEGHALLPRRDINITYPYFILCLFSASVHANEGSQIFFGGQCILIAWALWSQRSRRFGWNSWAGVLLVAFVLAFLAQLGLWRVERLVENYSPGWAERFLQHKADPAQNITALGQIGRLKLSSKIVIRLQPKHGSAPPAYLREASYRTYHSQIWHAGNTRDDFESVPAERDNTTWILLPGKTKTSVVNLACYLDGGKALLPLPSGSGRLENLKAFILQKNSTGAVLAEGPGLVIFDALFGPGRTIDSPPGDFPSETNADLFVPTNEMPALKQVIAEMKIPSEGEIKMLHAVSSFFSEKFQYSLWQGVDKRARTNETVLSRFLLQSRSGHCEYFATATVLLLRELGIPARYAVGYAVHETSGSGYVVRGRDAHAWCLVWDKQSRTWQDFDTTPASWVEAEQKRASIFQSFSDAWSWVWFEISKFRWGQSNFRQYMLWALMPVLALLLYQIIFRRGKKRLQKITESVVVPTTWAGLDSEFYQLERKLAERGAARQPNESFSDWLSRVLADPILADLRTPLWDLLRLHYCHRFDPRGLNPEERKKLKRDVALCLDTLARTRKPQNTGA